MTKTLPECPTSGHRVTVRGTVPPTVPDLYAGEIKALRELADERLARIERAESRADRLEGEVDRLRAELDRLHNRPWWHRLIGR
jgi:hypothetical protein